MTYGYNALTGNFDLVGATPAQLSGVAGNLTSYLSQSAGPVTFSGTTLTIPAQEAVVMGVPYSIPQQTLTVPVPSRTLATSTSGVIAYPNNPIEFTQVAFVVTNNSGGSVSGTITTNGYDEHYPVNGLGGASEVITIPTVTNGNSVTVVSTKYYGAGPGYNAANPALLGPGAPNSFFITLTSGTLGNSGVTISVNEYQFRSHLKITNNYNGDTPGNISYAWDCYFQPGEMQIAQFEIRAAGVISLIDWRLIGPQSMASRMGSDILDWSSFSPVGPLSQNQAVITNSNLNRQWNAQCIYAISQFLNGQIIIAGNTAALCIWDGQKFGLPFYLPYQVNSSATSGSSTKLFDTNQNWTVDQWKGWTVRLTGGTGAGQRVTITGNDATSLTVASWSVNPAAGTSYIISPLDNQLDHISALFDMGKNAVGDEIMYVGTQTGKIVQWNVSQGSYYVLNNPTGGRGITRMKKGPTTNSVLVSATLNGIFFITNNGASNPGVVPYANGSVSGTNTYWDCQYYKGYTYIAAGYSSGVIGLYRVSADNPYYKDLSPFLPGTSGQTTSGGSSSRGLSGICSDGEGKLIVAGNGSGWYTAEWDTDQQYAIGEIGFTVNATGVIPAGTVCTDGNGTTYTLMVDVTPTTGSGTWYGFAISNKPGDSGMAAIGTAITLTSSVSNVTGVAFSSACGMGRYVGTLAANTTPNDYPNSLLSNIPLSIGWTGSKVVITTQLGDVVTWDKTRWQVILKNPFKGRATFSFRDVVHGCTWLCGDEGKLMTIPT